MATSGPNYPTAATDVGSTWSFGSGGFSPTDTYVRNANQIKVDGDNSYAVCGNNYGVGSTVTSTLLVGSSFGFSIPLGATINGILVEINRNTATASAVKDVTVQLLKAGVAVGSNLAVTGSFWTTGLQRISYGGAANLWGTTWTPSDINNTSFGVQIALSVYRPIKVAVAAGIDSVRITVTYTAGSTSIPNRITAVFQAIKRASFY